MTVFSRSFIALRLFIGQKHLDGSRDQARKALLGAVLSIALSLIPLITVMQVADGMIQGIISRYIELATYHAQITPYPGLSLYEAKKALEDCKEISGAWIESQSLALVFSDGMNEGVSVRGIEQGFLDDPSTKKYLNLEKGSLNLERYNDALIGLALAEKLQVQPGDTVNLVSIKMSDSKKMLPKINIITIKGIVSAGYREIDAQWLLLRQDFVENKFPKEAVRSFIGVKGSDPLKKPFAGSSAAIACLPYGYSVLSWKEVASNLFESLKSTRTMLLIIMTLTVTVASFNISSALATMVLERQQEIALLKSIGALPADIYSIFTLGGAVLGAIGSVLGCTGGIIVSIYINDILHFIEKTNNVTRKVFSAFGSGNIVEDFKILDPAYYLENIPININYIDILIIACLTVFLSVLVSFGPARKAASFSPMEGLRRR